MAKTDPEPDESPHTTRDDSQQTFDEWTEVPDPVDDTDSDRGRHASFGFPGKLTAARNYAPVWATDEQIRDVAQEAFDRGVKAQRVWAERVNGGVDGYDD